MPIFPIVETESIVQESDKTRIDAQKSFVSGTTPITIYEIKATKLEAFVDVTAQKYLDWAYDFTLDVDSLNNKIDFNEGGPDLVATLTTGNYSLATLATEIKTQLDSAGAFTYTVTVGSDNAITIAATGSFKLLPVLGANVGFSVLPEIGYSTDSLFVTTLTGSKIETFTKTVAVKITNGSGNKTVTRDIDIVSTLADHLFSSDAELVPHEHDILKYVKPGRATMLDKHRTSQDRIMTRLDEMRIMNSNGSRMTKDQIVDIEEVNDWSKFLTLQVIFESIANAVDDVFSQKAIKYAKMARESENRSLLRWDQNKDGTQENSENTDMRSYRMVRR